LELEAIAAVHELSHEVRDISVSEMLPRTSDLIFVNVKTQEGQFSSVFLFISTFTVAFRTTIYTGADAERMAHRFISHGLHEWRLYKGVFYVPCPLNCIGILHQ
uniref:DUF727 domain-containing protein n=1 Tax=Heligmosomoides polygyrus TaxID=6339 RepID=A0A183GKE5_HELPZ